MKDIYEAELFQESYLPAYQASLAKKIRDRKALADNRKIKEQENAKKVQDMGKDD